MKMEGMVSSCKLGQRQRRQEQHEKGMRRHRAKAALVLCTCLLAPSGTKGDSPNYVGRELSDYNGKFGRGIKLEVNLQATPQSALLSALCLSLPRTRLLLCLWHVILDASSIWFSATLLSSLRFVCVSYAGWKILAWHDRQ